MAVIFVVDLSMSTLATTADEPDEDNQLDSPS